MTSPAKTVVQTTPRSSFKKRGQSLRRNSNDILEVSTNKDKNLPYTSKRDRIVALVMNKEIS